MLIERPVVGRKTPLDGRLEISDAAAERLAPLGAEFALESAGRAAAARLEAMPCTCARAAHGPHVHRFVASPLLRELPAGATVRLELDGARRVVRIEIEDGSAPR